MKNTVPNILTILFITAVGIISSCRNSIEEINAITYKDTFPVESAVNVEMLYSDSGIVKAFFKSPVVNRYIGDESYIILPKGLTIYFFDENKEVKTSLTARYAIKYENKDFMEAKNDVVVVNRIGERLNTEHLMWDQVQRKIYSDVFVKITRQDEVLYGYGFEADETFEKWIMKDPRGSFNIDVDEEENSAQ